MGVKGGPDIETDGLVFHLDAASSSIGKGYSTEGLRVEYLIVGGGGGSAPAYNVHASSGGGGAGAFREGSIFINSGTNFSIVVGAGGSRTTTANCGRGSVGGDSIAFGLISNGGAGAGTWCSSGTYGLMAGTSNGNASGSGSGGAGISTANVGGSGGEFGNNGGSHTGTGNSNGTTSCGGGGGAGGPGGNGVANQLGGNGGIGKSSNITGRGVFYAGGGAGGSTKGINNDGGGRGGGGNRGNPPNNTTGGSNPGENGSTNTGGGGGGASGGRNTANGGNGGSGIVILRYRGKQKATGGTITYKNGYTIHTFTSSGTLTFDNDLSNGFINGTSSNKIVGELKNMGSGNYNSENKGYWTFDGTNERILLSQTVSGDHKTIVYWIEYPDSLVNDASGGQGPVMSALSGGATIWSGGFSSATSGEVLNIYDGSRFTYAKGTINSGWRHIAFRWNNSYYDIFIDGVQTTSYIGVTGANLHCSLLSNKFAEIGARSSNNQYLSGRFLSTPPAKIANISIYNISLSDLQILDNYNATKGRFGL